MENWKNTKDRTISIFIIFFVALVVLWPIPKVISSINKTVNMQTVTTKESVCVEKRTIVDSLKVKRMVILRLDDVQAFSWDDVSIKLIEGALSNDAPISVGVIPKGIRDDVKITSFLKQEHCNIEIALHGWDHGRSKYDSENKIEAPPEFRGLNYDQAKNIIRDGKKELEDIFGKKVLTFIPPNNESSIGTIEALRDEGFSVYSSAEGGIFDNTISTYDFDSKAVSSIENITSFCDKKFSKGKVCVVVIHPQEYSNSDETLNNDLYEHHYLEMIKQLHQKGASFATFKMLNEFGIKDEKLSPPEEVRNFTSGQE